MSTRRLYIDQAHDHSFLTGATLQGLGEDMILKKWPSGRTYHDVGRFRSPYTSAYYQSGSLLGLGDVPSGIAANIDRAAPPDVKRFLLSGEPVPKLTTNVSLPFNQIPRLGYGIIAVAAAGLSYFSYKRFKKTAKGHGTSGG